MKTILSAILLAASLLWICELTVTFNPFSVSLPAWYKIVGILFFWLSMIIYTRGENAKYYNKGYQDGSEDTIDDIERRMFEMQKMEDSEQTL